MSSSPDLIEHTPAEDASRAQIAIDTGTRADTAVDPKLFGKFCEHLGNNVYHGMEAQILFNPTFGEWHFRADNGRPSGGFGSQWDPDRIEEVVETHGRPLAYPASTDTEALLEAYRDGLAFGWTTLGPETRVSPDTGPDGKRAQRVEVEAGGGVGQETRLPLHRTREFEFRCRARAADAATVAIAVRPADEGAVDADGAPLASATVDLDGTWATVTGEFSLPATADEDAVYEVSFETAGPANVVVERLLLYPADHVDYADPDVVRFLRESELPLLRWPGGNFVSGYDWRDGVGPVDERPTTPNPAWGGLEPNLFGTAEFVQFCEHVGCEPSICVNAGDGTPEEAAAWVEYCNGDPDETEMGRLRAEHGHPDPFGITYWEIGNELYGHWQVRWTTPEGNVDRYRRFREAMLDADPDIEVTACGRVAHADTEWNRVLLAEAGSELSAISDHVLMGGRVDADTDPDELYHAFTGFSSQLGDSYRDLRERMREAGVTDPRVDVTELQLFANFHEDAEGAGREAGGSDGDSDDGGGLTPETMPTPTTITEALYDATVRHELIRLGEFAGMLTHSATVNHGGGLRKAGERVWADPCHYGRELGMALAGGTPLGVELTCDTVSTEDAFGEIEPIDDVPAVDAMAVLSEGGSELVVIVVNRASREDATRVALDLGDFHAAGEADVATLVGGAMHDGNTRAEPERVAPERSTAVVEDGSVTFDLAPYSMVRLAIPAADAA